VDAQFHPEFGRLMDDDEEQFVVFVESGFWHASKSGS